MKTVLMIAYYYPPDSSSGVYRTLYFANHLKRSKYCHPIILTPDEAFYSWEQKKDYSLLKKIDPDIKIVRTGCMQLREKIIGLGGKRNYKRQSFKESLKKSGKLRKGLFRRIIDIFTEEVLAFPDRQIGWFPYAVRDGIVTARKNKVDLIYSSGSPWSAHLIGVLLKWILNIPLVLDYRDPWNQNTFSEKKSKLFRFLSEQLEKRILKFVDAVICNTHLLRETFFDNYYNLGKEKLYVIPNGFEEKDLVLENLKKVELQKNEFVFIHVGSLYGNRNIGNFIHSIKRLEGEGLLENSKFILIGVGDEIVQEIAAICGNDMQRKKFLTMDRIEHARCISYLESSDCFLLFQQGTTLQVPRKIYEYIALKKPILAITPRKGETANLVLENNLGVVVDDNVDDICNGIIDIKTNYDKFLISISKKQAFMKYNNQKLTEDLNKVFLDVMNA